MDKHAADTKDMVSTVPPVKEMAEKAFKDVDSGPSEKAQPADLWKYINTKHPASPAPKLSPVSAPEFSDCNCHLKRCWDQV